MSNEQAIDNMSFSEDKFSDDSRLHLAQIIDNINAAIINCLCSLYFFCFTAINAAISNTAIMLLTKALITAKMCTSNGMETFSLKPPNNATTVNTTTEKIPMSHFACLSFFGSVACNIA